MKVAIMQPYFFPYIGYFQLINAVEKFIVYDNIQYTKKGWINRNRILVNGKDEYISVPLKKDSDYLNIGQRVLASTWSQDKRKLINKISEVYRKAPFFDESRIVFERCINFENDNLFYFILNSIKIINEHLNIETQIIISSDLKIDHGLKAVDKVLAICETLNAKTYVNPIGGIDLYKKEVFLDRGIELNFLKANNILYKQFNSSFSPFLSIIDVIMFNGKEKTIEFINKEFILI